MSRSARALAHLRRGQRMSSRRRLVIVGAGGFAREVRWLASCASDGIVDYDFMGYVVSDLDKLGATDSTSEVLGDYDWLASNLARVDAAAIGIGSPSARIKVGNE